MLGEIHAAAKEAAYAPFFEPKFAAGAIQDRRTRWREQVKVGAGTILLAVLDSRPLSAVLLPSVLDPAGYSGDP